MAFALREKGIPIVLVYVNEPPNYNPQEYFDFAIKAQDEDDAIGIVHRIRPDIVHVFSAGADRTTYGFFQNRIGKVIYDYKDCFENVLSYPMRIHIYAAQRYCVENADGLCCRDLQLWNYCRVNRIHPRGKRILFLDYCWGKNTDKTKLRNDGEVHTVVAGNFSIEKTEPSEIDSGYLYISRALVAKGVHVHVYLYRQYETQAQSDANQSRLSDYIDLENQSPFFHIHSPVPMTQFVEELSQYDYGLLIRQGALFREIGITVTLNGHEKHGISTRSFDYLEAGLDILASPELWFNYRLMHNASIVVPATLKLFSQSDTKMVLSDWMGNYKQLRMKAARERFDIRNNIGRLIDFYLSV